jgi:16S rRNA (cytidine1402-2'-O)-methyltransferase
MARDGSQPNERERGGKATTLCPPGTLYVVSTPIGHPDDITLRALGVLRRATIVASEDPRTTQMLLAYQALPQQSQATARLIAMKKCGSFCTGS